MSGAAREPFDAIQKGDVIRWNGRLRTVRKLSHDADGRVQSVTFAILRKSWTNRPYTTYTRSEIRACYGGVVAKRKDKTLCATPLECKVQKEIENPAMWAKDQRISARVMAGRVW